LNNNRLGQIGVPAAIVGVVIMLVVPLPAAVLDLLLVLNLSLAVVILLACMYVTKPLEFSVFPSLLLVATMFRLALNVSSARLVLLHAHAGQVIDAFGHFVVGGQIVVGLVIFLILVIIQFVVITNGAGRVAEVAARFTLDAMPGKQMAIDADLNTGVISDIEARERRAEIAAEADFYGAMDGASKFVKGDAIAGIIITIVNLFGGFATGVVQKGMSVTDAIHTYSLLTVGDGLVSQIPALLISISSGLIVTRAASSQDMGSDLLQQFGRQGRALQVAAGVICGMGLIPGLPKIPFFGVAAGLWVVGGRSQKASDEVDRQAAVVAANRTKPGEAPAPKPDSPEALASEMRVDPLELEIGFAIMDLVDPGRGGDLLDRVRALRRKIALDLGLVIPPVRTRDNIELGANSYVLRVHGVEAGRGESPPGTVLVLGDRPPGIPGEDTLDPVFGMAAAWVPAEFAKQAEIAGGTVVDRGSVITAHLAEVVRTHAARLLSRQDVKLLVDGVRSSDPIVAEELTGAGLNLAEVQRVLQALLEEGVGIRDLVRILEVLSERARTNKDPEQLTEAVRGALGPAIASSHATGGRLSAITFDAVIEHSLADAIRNGDNGAFLAVEPDVAERIILEIAGLVDAAENNGDNPVLVCSVHLRPAVRKLLRGVKPGLAVLSYAELGTQLQIDTVGVVNLAQAAAL
jgi:flagellar biosynthesis protein FlhA